MKRTILAITTIACAATMCAGLAACGGGDPNADSLMLHLAFDEGAGTAVTDSSGHLEDEELRYVFNDPVYQDEPQDPQWRDTGVSGGSLLMDGYSNYIRYSEDDIVLSGSSFTVSAWVAPRMFEWDDPNAAENGTEYLTAIVSQYDEAGNAGVLLGYHRHGAWSFQVGIGDRFIKLWDDGHPLTKYEWNHVAATFDGATGTMAMYLNGEQIATRTVYEGAAIEACPTWLYIGRNSDSNTVGSATCNMHSGLIDEVKLYNTAVSAEDIRSQYQSALVDGELPEITFEDIWLQNILTEDYHKPQYHGGPYQHWMNEPHAPFYYNGKYHLFFQFNINGPYFRNICWGHLVSDDMVNWTPLKEVITPTAGTIAPDGIWSGGAAYDVDGSPVLFFTAGNDSWSSSGDGLVGNQNIGIARPKDLSDPNLTEWVVDEEYAVKQQSGQGRSGDFRDAYVYQETEGVVTTWYMLICSASTSSAGGTALLYTTDSTKTDYFHNWDYKGQLYTMPNQPAMYGETWELPVLFPIENEAGTIQKWFFAFSPAPADRADNDIYYLLGDFDGERFIPETGFGEPRRLDYGNNVFTGPSAFRDPVSGKWYMFSIMQDQRLANDQISSGWAHTAGLAREIYLSDDGAQACIRPVDALEEYESEVYVDETGEMTVAAANEVLSDVKGDMLHVKITFRVDAGAAPRFGMHLRTNGEGEYTEYYYNAATQRLGVVTTFAGDQNIYGDFNDTFVLNEDGTLTMEFYMDRSLIEGFFNDSKAVTARVYPTDRNSMGLEVFGENVTITSLYVAQMQSIYTS